MSKYKYVPLALWSLNIAMSIFFAVYKEEYFSNNYRNIYVTVCILGLIAAIKQIHKENETNRK